MVSLYCKAVCCVFVFFFCFFFKQKTAYEVLRSLVGSEMCIRDSISMVDELKEENTELKMEIAKLKLELRQTEAAVKAVSYTHLTLPTIYSV